VSAAHCLRTLHSPRLSSESTSEQTKAESTVPSLTDVLNCSATSAKLTHRTITHGHFKPPSVVYLIGDTQVVVLTSPCCRQSRPTSRLRTSASPQPGVLHTDVLAGVMLRKQLYSGRSKALDDDDDILPCAV